MDSNPEEFTENGRWEKLIVRYRSYLPMQDRTAMEDKINALRLDVFHKDVMNELLAEPRDHTELINDYVRVASGAASTIPAGITAAVPTITNTTANLNLSRQSIKEIAAQLQSYASNTWKP
jgi:hypothetical protein